MQGWVNPSILPSSAGFKLFYLGEGTVRNLHLQYLPSGHLEFNNWESAISGSSYPAMTVLASNSTVSPNLWTHISVVYENQTLKLYINGLLDATSSVNLSIPQNGLICVLSFSGNIRNIRNR